MKMFIQRIANLWQQRVQGQWLTTLLENKEDYNALRAQENQDNSENDIIFSIRQSQARYLRRTRLYLLAAISVTLAFFITSYYVERDVIVPATGTIQAASKNVLIQSEEPGTVLSLAVQEGDVVREGQTLMTLSNPTLIGDRGERRALLASQKLKRHRLAAIIAKQENIDWESDPEIVKLGQQYPLMRDSEEANFKSVMTNLNEIINGVEAEIDVLNTQVFAAKAGLEPLYRQRASLNTQHKREMEAVKAGVLATRDAESVKRQIANIDSEIARIKGQAATSEAEAVRAAIKKDETIKKLFAETQQDLTETEGRISALVATTTAAEERAATNVKTSPVNGVIQQVLIQQGSVIEVSKTLIEIVPIAETFRIEGKVEPRDIALVYIDAPARVRLTAYDASQYGVIRAKVIEVSADAIVSEEKDGSTRSSYRIKVEAEDRGNIPDEMPIKPGMEATIDILAGRRTLFSAIFSKIERGVETALTQK